MKSLMIVAVAFLVLLVSGVARADYEYVSPRKGEGPVQIAERLKIDPVEFIRLNKKLGLFRYPERPSLVYEWQKFAIPSSEKLQQGEFIKKEECQKLVQESQIKAQQDKEIIAIPSEPESKMAKSELTEPSSEEKKENLNLLIAVLCIFFLFVALAILIYNLRDIFENKKTDIFEKKFHVLFSNKLRSYCMLKDKNLDVVLNAKNSLPELAEAAFPTVMDNVLINIENTFSFDISSFGTQKNSWRNLSQNEKELFLKEVRQLLEAYIEKIYE